MKFSSTTTQATHVLLLALAVACFPLTIASENNLRVKNGAGDSSTRLLQSASYTKYEGACRINSNGTGEGSSPNEYDLYGSGETLNSCKNRCTSRSDCMAFEYGSGSGRCEIWKITPGGWSSSGQLKCYHKNIYSPTPAPAPTHPASPPSNSNYDECKEVHRRPIYGTGDLPLSLDYDQGYQLLASHYKPFGGYYVPDHKSGSVRKWRVYAIYNDGKKSTSNYYNYINIKFADLVNSDRDIVFTLPTTSGMYEEYTYRGEGYSEFYQAPKNNDDKMVYAQFYTTDPYNLYGKVFWVELVAYDCYAH